MPKPKHKYPEDMEYDEFKQVHITAICDAIITKGFGGVSPIIDNIIYCTLNNKVFGGKKNESK